MAGKTDLSTYKFNHTMLRIKDPKVSIEWYTRVLGMKLVNEHDGGSFTLYFLAFVPEGEDYKKKGYQFQREGILELTHNHGTESDPNFKGYHNGNDEPQGFGHIAVAVDDVQAACDRFEKEGVTFQKKPQDGKMKHIAFIKDPDGYWAEIVPTHSSGV